MSIIYSYPEQSTLNAGDMLIGTSVEKVGGKQKNVTKNFTVQQIADFINQGTGFVDPVATDFQIPVFNQEGKKITGSIMSQNVYPGGSAITIAGSLTATSDISTVGNLSANGFVTLGSQNNLISLNSLTKLGGPIKDSAGTLGNVNQILISNGSGNVVWQNYEAGLTYEGTWDANANTTNGLSNSPALLQGVGVSGHFYIVNVEGTTSLGQGLNDWHVGDWAVFLDEGGQPASWQKIDNTSTLAGSGTAGTFAKWTNATTLNDSIMSESGSVVTIGGSLKIQDTLEATTANTNLKLKGAGTGGVEIMSADGVTVGKITLNCEVNSHGITIQSPPHPYASYALALPVSTGTVGQVLTSGGASPQLTWSTIVDTNTTYDLGSSTDGSNVRLNLDASTGTDSFVTLVGSGIGIAQVNDTVTFTVPAGDTYDLSAGAKSGTSVPLNLTSGSGTDNSLVSLTEGTGITLTRTSATEITIAGAAQGVTSVTGDSATIAVTSGNTPQVSAITTGGVSPTSSSLATGAQIQTAIDTALAGTLTFKGTFNASTGVITSGTNNGLQLYSGNTGVIAITKGDFYIADTAGSFYNTTSMNVGDEAIALFTVAAAPPGSAITDWSVVPAQSAGVTGSGTISYVPKFTGSTVVGDSNIFDDQGSIGIGTISPVSALHVSTTVNEVLTLESITSSQKIRFADINNNSNDCDFGSTNGDLAIFTNNNATPNVQSFTFNKDGKLGVGQFSTSPTANLDISDLFFSPSLRLYGGNTGSELKIEVSNFFGNFDTTINSAQNDLIFQGNNSAIMSLGVSGANPSLPTGSLKLNQYGQGNKTGTATYNLAVDGLGNVIEETSGGGASNIVSSNHASNGTVGPFNLGGTPSGTDKAFVDVFIDGVYQQISTYNLAGVNNDEIEFVNAVPSGVTIETKTTTGINSGAAVTSVDLGQTQTTGAINLRITPSYVTNNDLAHANHLYIFDDTVNAYTLTLPSGPQPGDSIKISNRGGLATNVLAVPATENIMGGVLGASMTINNATAAFEIIYSGDSSKQGWVIIGNV